MQAIARFIEHLDLKPIILHERASKGSTIVEKLEGHSDVAFAVVLLTPDDVGSVATDQNDLQPRARQNVVLELGYFMGRLGRKRTCALVVKGVEIPTDYSGVVYIPIDEEDAWKFKLAKEFQAAGLAIDMNKIR
jgi:predicted nucleotide-binding protein